MLLSVVWICLVYECFWFPTCVDMYVEITKIQKEKSPLRGLRVCLRKTILASLRVYCDSRDILCLQCFPLGGSNQISNYSKCQYVINGMHQLTRLIWRIDSFKGGFGFSCLPKTSNNFTCFNLIHSFICFNTCLQLSNVWVLLKIDNMWFLRRKNLTK